MCKRILAILCLIALAFAFPAFAVDDWICPDCGAHVPEAMGSICPYCGGHRHEHTWQDATCVSPKTCFECGETEGEALGHDWVGATCTSPQTCARCGATQGEPLGHDWRDVTCETPVTCARCGETAGNALGHEWVEATCEAPKTCRRCGATEGEALGHDWMAATFEAPKTCRRCGATEGKALKNPEVGDRLTFGHYPQTASRTDSTPIEWRVLEVRDDGCAVVISEKGLDCRRYNVELDYVTWETCSLRKWLNGDFLSAAFTPEEQARLITVNVTADENPNYSTNPGNDTQDRVYLLSIDEANRYFSNDEDRVCYPTAYAEAQGAYTYNAACWWWLRSPGNLSDFAARVYYDGSVLYYGSGVDNDYTAVRPVVVLRLS